MAEVQSGEYPSAHVRPWVATGALLLALVSALGVGRLGSVAGPLGVSIQRSISVSYDR
jgi:hypothetical protein